MTVPKSRWDTGGAGETKLTGETLKTLERHYAHFHRVLGALLTELAALPGVVWLEDEQCHQLTPDGERNSYHKALYPLSDLAPYSRVLSELSAVQQQATALAGRHVPLPGLLLPQVIEDVAYARLNQHIQYTSQPFEKARALARLKTMLLRTQSNLREFEAYSSGFDPKREAIEQEVRLLAVTQDRIRAAAASHYRFRTGRRNVVPYVYRRDGSVTQAAYVRDHGLLLVGPQVEIRWNEEKRRPRNDKRQLEPLLKLGMLEVYEESAWQQAGER